MDSTHDKPRSGRGGYRPGAGRPPKSMNKLAKEAVEKARGTGELPHEFLLRIARGEVIYREVVDPRTGRATTVREDYSFEDRKDAAKAAAPYFAPKISTVEVITGVDDDELDRIIASLATEAGISLGASGAEPEDEAEGRAPARRRVRLTE